jgi:DNA repair protein RadD
MDIKKVIDRFDINVYQDILGDEIIGTLAILDFQYNYVSNYKKVFLNNFQINELLLVPKIRNHIFNALRKEEVRELNLHLELNIETEWQGLLNCNFNKRKLHSLYEYFELVFPEIEREVIVYEEFCKPNYLLYDYQRNVINEMERIIRSDRPRLMLHMPTGSGKTRTAISLICRFFLTEERKNIIWFANSLELLDQAFWEFKRAWSSLGNREIKVVRYWGSADVEIKEIKGAFIVAGIDKAYSSLMRNAGDMTNFAAKLGLVVMDEAHQAIAPTYSLMIDVCTNLNNIPLIGLSATPGRTWNEPNKDLELANYFFKQKVMIKIAGYSSPVSYLVNSGYLAKLEYKNLFHKSGIQLSEKDFEYLKTHFQFSDKVLKEISMDRLRNIKIVSTIKLLLDKHQRIIVFGITKKHAILINSLLTAIGIDSNVVTSDTSNTERMRVISKFKISRVENPNPMVLCNYGILTTGFDAPEISCAVIARPTDSLVLYSQMIGRAIRGPKSGGNNISEIVSVIDEDLPGFGDLAEAFLNWEDVWN